MKSLLKILVPVFFVAAIGLFVGFKSGIFDSEKPASKPEKAIKKEPVVSPKTETSAEALSPDKEATPPAPKTVKVKEQKKMEPAETTRVFYVDPVVIPSSKSGIMINPTIDKKSIFDGEKVPSKQSPKKQKVMPSSKSGVIINP